MRTSLDNGFYKQCVWDMPCTCLCICLHARPCTHVFTYWHDRLGRRRRHSKEQSTKRRRNEGCRSLNVPCGIPFGIPSNHPSDVPCGTPSNVPSVPSNIPSGIPSGIPSNVPLSAIDHEALRERWAQEPLARVPRRQHFGYLGGSVFIIGST